MSNEIISLVLAVIMALTGAVGLTSQDQFTEQVYADVNSVNNTVTGVAESQAKYQAGEIGIGQYRADWQDAKIFINDKYQDACKDTDLNPEQRKLNEKYKAYLLDCINAVDKFSMGENPAIPKWDN